MRGLLKISRIGLALSLVAWTLLFLGQPERVGSLVPAWLPLVSAIAALILLVRSRPRPHARIFACGLLILAAIAFLSVRADMEGRFETQWRRSESRKVVAKLREVARRLESMQTLSSTIGRDTESFLTGRDGFTRFEIFNHLEEAARRASGALPRGTQMGLQIIDPDGRRLAWAGWPQPLEQRDVTFATSGTEVIYTERVSLYQIMRHMVPVHDSDGETIGTLLIDLPLEVNYKVNNSFLKSTGFADDQSGDIANIHFDYYPAEVRLPSLMGRHMDELAKREKEISALANRRPSREARADSALTYAALPATVKPIGEIGGDPVSGLQARALVHSTLGNYLFHVSITGRPHRFYIDTLQGQLRVLSSTLAMLALAIYLVLLYRAFPSRRSVVWGVAKAAYVTGVLVLTRYWFLSIEPHLVSTDWKAFDPAVFATPIFGGIMRSAGDLLLTSVFFVATLYTVLRIVRRTLPRGTTTPPRWLFLPKGLFAALAFYGAHEVASGFVGTVVVNANPRLLGNAMRLLESYTGLLQFSVFLMTSGFFLAAVILVWGVFRIKGRSDNTRASWVAAAASILIAVAAWRWEIAFVLLLLVAFAAVAPRVTQREDLVSIVGMAFGFVVVVSSAAYVFLNEDYQGLRRTFIQERVDELTHPSDNWKVFILEDVLEELSQDNRLQQALLRGSSTQVQSLAFDLWAESSLSYLGYSSAIHVFDARDSLVSRFTVEMPYRVRFEEEGERLETTSGQEWVVLDLTTATPNGIVRFYRGILNVGSFGGNPFGLRGSGRVVVDIPFFFENLSWAARTGPQTPAVLRNIQEGGISPRIEETEALLLARIEDMRVTETSSSALPVGVRIGATGLDAGLAREWPVLNTRGASYRYLVQETETPGRYLLAGFPVPSALQHILRWSTIFSLYFVFTVGIIVVIIVLRTLPAVGHLLPSLTPGRQLGFQQKILGSFLLISLLPSVILGVFSVRLIKDRFIQENRNEALTKALTIQKTLSNLVVDELDYVLDHSDLRDIADGSALARDPARRIEVIPASPAGGADTTLVVTEAMRFAARFGPAEPFVHELDRTTFLGVFSRPIDVVVDEEPRTFTVLYERRLDVDLLGKLADEIGADINIYHDGELVASSREGLIFGGFISPFMNGDAFAKLSLMGVDRSVGSERAGDYQYEVAYVPIGEVAAVGLPLLFRPESFHVEVQKATSIVLSVFALLSAVTIGLGLLLARGIFEPLKRLLEGTRRITRGDLTVRLASPRRDEIGTVVEAFNEMTDQVARSRKDLEERRRYLEVILANIGTGVVSTDGEGRIQAINNAAARILGVDAGAVTGRHASDLSASDITPEFFALLSRASTENEPFVSSELTVTREGETRTIKYMQTRLANEGRYLGTVYVFEDLTELINSKKLSAWVEMARQIAHEIKNPLTPIKLSTQFMLRAREQKAEDFDQIFEESAGTIMQQVEVLRRIASEFSSFGRMQTIEVGPHGLVPQLENIVAPYRRNASGVEITFNCDDRDVRAMMNEEALRKICVNLIENALEAMPDGGQLDITCDTAALNGKELVRVSFRDSGPGLDEEVKKKLFEPYFSTKTTGTGLGLAICRRLSREMGGDVILVNLAEGRGAEASLYLQPA